MQGQARLSAIFRAALDRPDDSLGDDAMQRALGDYVGAARSVWPDFGVADEEFVRYVAARSPRGQLPDAGHAGDMLLACACARGVAAGVDAFHRSYGVVIARVLSRRRAAADLAQDATQAVYERLLVAAPGGTPKIAEYRGTGPLRSWVSTVAATTLLMMRRAAGRRREEPQDSSGSRDLMTVGDPELLYMKERYKAETEGALARALARLGDRERTLLRLHLTERLTIDQLATMYRVNRATAARWLAAARESIVLAAHDELRARLRVRPSEVDSIVAMVRSELNVSIARRLA